jgi:hypothetical protein
MNITVSRAARPDRQHFSDLVNVKASHDRPVEVSRAGAAVRDLLARPKEG